MFSFFLHTPSLIITHTHRHTHWEVQCSQVSSQLQSHLLCAYDGGVCSSKHGTNIGCGCTLSYVGSVSFVSFTVFCQNWPDISNSNSGRPIPQSEGCHATSLDSDTRRNEAWQSVISHLPIDFLISTRKKFAKMETVTQISLRSAHTSFHHPKTWVSNWQAAVHLWPAGR